MSAVDMHSPSDGNESISRDCSIIVPFYNEEDNVVEVLNEILSCCPHAEIIAVDDGSQDQTWERIKTVSRIKAFGFASNQGQSAAVFEGLKQATMPICILMDGDGQNDPADIPEMLNQLNTSRADVICGFRANRKDTWSRR